jgi:outer membrane murein-binding lipoprotein Lpp
MRIAKTLTALAVVAVSLFLNGCTCKDKITGETTETQATPIPTPSPRA